jgi:hypothetical protein
MKLASALLTGLLFGIGLVLSGMANPAKVLSFLDLAGHWDPSLAFAMAGALLGASPAYALARRRGRTITGEPLQLPSSTRIDRRLVLGSLAFGVGWGLSGFCPGPAVASLLLGAKPLLFFAAMVAGMAIHAWFERRPR